MPKRVLWESLRLLCFIFDVFDPVLYLRIDVIKDRGRHVELLRRTPDQTMLSFYLTFGFCLRNMSPP